MNLWLLLLLAVLVIAALGIGAWWAGVDGTRRDAERERFWRSGRD